MKHTSHITPNFVTFFLLYLFLKTSLSKANKTSKEVQLFSQDIIRSVEQSKILEKFLTVMFWRFGSSVVDKDQTVEKCVCARVEIYDQSGRARPHRPPHNK